MFQTYSMKMRVIELQESHQKPDLIRIMIIQQETQLTFIFNKTVLLNALQLLCLSRKRRNLKRKRRIIEEGLVSNLHVSIDLIYFISFQWVYKYSSVCAARTGQFRWPDDCHKYVDCWRGQGTLKSCFPSNLVFNEANGQCDWPRLGQRKLKLF